VNREEIEKQLKEMYPNGHPGFIKLAIDCMELHSQKNGDYAKGGDPLGNFDRVSRIMQIYPGIEWATKVGVALTYRLKQMDCYMNMLAQKYEGQVEGKGKRLEDQYVYAMIERLILDDEDKIKNLVHWKKDHKSEVDNDDFINVKET
jgi:hypothetical protein